MSGGNVLLNSDGGASGAGARLTLDLDGDILHESESITIDFVIGHQSINSFTFLVDLLADPEFNLAIK